MSLTYRVVRLKSIQVEPGFLLEFPFLNPDPNHTVLCDVEKSSPTHRLEMNQPTRGLMSCDARRVFVQTAMACYKSFTLV